MTDETTARDRAQDWRIADDAEIVNVHTGEQLVSTYGDRELAEYIVQAVNAYRLRALAGAPTADVAAELKRYGDLPLDAAFLVYGEPEQLIFRGPTGQVVLRRVHAAPEGVDVADELARLREQLAARDELIDRIQNDDVPPDGFDVEPPEAWWSESYGLIGQRVTDGRYVMHTWQNKLLEELPDDAVPLRGPTGRRAPEGVDAADEQDECATPVHHPLTVCRTCHPHEWTQRKSAEIANSGRCVCTEDDACAEHEALEAANQRVREYLAENGTVLMPGTQEVVIKAGVLRALDGDTTEEGR